MNDYEMHQILKTAYEQKEKYEKEFIVKYSNKKFICKCCKRNLKIINKNGIIQRYKKIIYYIDKINISCFSCYKS